MSPEEIKSKLKERRLTGREIARRAGVSQSAVQLWIKGVMTSANIERYMARALGMKVADLRAARAAQKAA